MTTNLDFSKSLRWIYSWLVDDLFSVSISKCMHFRRWRHFAPFFDWKWINSCSRIPNDLVVSFFFSISHLDLFASCENLKTKPGNPTSPRRAFELCVLEYKACC